MTDVHIKMLKTFREFLFNVKAREKVLYGGSSSGKTYAIQQYCIRKAMEEPNGASLVVMETRPGNLTGMFYPMCDMLDNPSIYAGKVPYTSRETAPANITLSNGHIIWFTSADKSEKMKYFDNIQRVLINEATALKQEDFRQLMNRMGRTAPAEIIFTFNPIDEQHWLIQDYVIPYLNGTMAKDKPDASVHHSTWRDNKFLAPEWCDWMEKMVSVDPNFYRVYSLGLPGKLEGLIYIEGTNWIHQSLNEWPQEVQMIPPHAIGVDFGFNDPTTAIAVWDWGGKRYAHELIYLPMLTQADFAQKLKVLMDQAQWKNIPMICDSAEPARIEDLRRRGFNAAPALKDVKYGIDVVRQKHLIISSESTDLIKEIRNYRWMQGKEGETMIDKPVDAFNHALDALRYALATRPPQKRNVLIEAADSYQSMFSRGYRRR